MSTRISDPIVNKLLVDARLETLRGGRPFRPARRSARPN